MARKVLTETIDDLTGESNAAPFTFALDGVAYEIDLADDGQSLKDALRPFITAGRRRAQTRTHSAKPASVDPHAIRGWAAANGFAVAERGRIPANLADAYKNRNP